MKHKTAKNIVFLIKYFVIVLIVGTVVGVLQKDKEPPPTGDILAEKEFMTQANQTQRQLQEKGYATRIEWTNRRACGFYILKAKRSDFQITYCSGWKLLPSQTGNKKYLKMVAEVDSLTTAKGFRRAGYFD